MRYVRAGRWTWLWAWVWFFFIQQLARMFTRPELNVNVAHSIYPGWERFFGAYWQYWVFVVVTAAFGLYVVGRLLQWYAPPLDVKEPTPAAAQAD